MVCHKKTKKTHRKLNLFQNRDVDPPERRIYRLVNGQSQGHIPPGPDTTQIQWGFARVWSTWVRQWILPHPMRFANFMQACPQAQLFVGLRFIFMQMRYKKCSRTHNVGGSRLPHNQEEDPEDGQKPRICWVWDLVHALQIKLDWNICPKRKRDVPVRCAKRGRWREKEQEIR